MNNRNEATRRVPLRTQRAEIRSRRKNDTFFSKSSFITRLNICITVVAALLLFSKINTELTDKITEKASQMITETTSFSAAADKIKDICLSFTSEKTDVFSEDSPDIDKTITKQIEQNKLMEEQLKNK